METLHPFCYGSTTNHNINVALVQISPFTIKGPGEVSVHHLQAPPPVVEVQCHGIVPSVGSWRKLMLKLWVKNLARVSRRFGNYSWRLEGLENLRSIAGLKLPLLCCCK